MRPVVIAHRGASGHLPEHTLQAKALAFAMGADYLEQDIVATRDDRLVVLHDIHLEGVTDVASRYPDRARADGRYYVRDFDLVEIETLRVHERRNAEGHQVFPGRRSYDGADFRVHTLERELQLVKTLSANTERDVGIYPEIKSPAWHREEGVDISALVLDTLGRFGYTTHSDPCYLQCFEMEEVLRIRHELGAELKLVQLIGEDEDNTTPTDFVALLASSSVAALVATIDGLGPDIEQLYRIVEGDVVDTGLVRLAHDLGLVVHPYTFRDDALPEGFDSIDELYAFAIRDLSVDGLFTDFPDSAVRFLRERQ
jgi:glycerophosphoryl diester phosphodiesterase